MNRRTFVSMLGVGGVVVAANPLACAQSPAKPGGPPKVKNVVLVHGAYADGSCWSDVIPILHSHGMTVASVQNPLRTLDEDVAFTDRTLALMDGPTMLVGHSYSGMVITQAGVDPKVTALVYVAARAPDADEDYTALAKTFPTPPASAGLVKGADGYAQLSEQAFLTDFAQDVDQARARTLYAVQGRISPELFSGRVSHAAWRFKRSFYAVSRNDRTINPDLEQFMARRMNATTVELDAGHLSMISKAHGVAALILQAADAGPTMTSR